MKDIGDVLRALAEGKRARLPRWERGVELWLEPARTAGNGTPVKPQVMITCQDGEATAFAYGQWDVWDDGWEILADPEASEEPEQPCAGFRWVGQPFSTCDRCGLPYWDHSHEERLDRDRGPLARDALTLVPITPEQAAACQAKWGNPRKEAS